MPKAFTQPTLDTLPAGDGKTALDRARQAVAQFRLFEDAPAANPIEGFFKKISRPLRLRRFFKTLHDVTAERHDTVVAFKAAGWLFDKEGAFCRSERQSADGQTRILEVNDPQAPARDFILTDLRANARLAVHAAPRYGLLIDDRAPSPDEAAAAAARLRPPQKVVITFIHEA